MATHVYAVLAERPQSPDLTPRKLYHIEEFRVDGEIFYIRDDTGRRIGCLRHNCTYAQREVDVRNRDTPQQQWSFLVDVNQTLDPDGTAGAGRIVGGGTGRIVWDNDNDNDEDTDEED